MSLYRLQETPTFAPHGSNCTPAVITQPSDSTTRAATSCFTPNYLGKMLMTSVGARAAILLLSMTTRNRRTCRPLCYVITRGKTSGSVYMTKIQRASTIGCQVCEHGSECKEIALAVVKKLCI